MLQRHVLRQILGELEIGSIIAPARLAHPERKRPKPLIERSPSMCRSSWVPRILCATMQLSLGDKLRLAASEHAHNLLCQLYS